MWVLVTGGTGSLGHALVPRLLEEEGVEKVIIYSRDEVKQSQMREEINDKRLRFMVGDVRDRWRTHRAMTGVHTVIHAAALKRVEVSEYNADEFIKTNIIGTQNVVEAAGLAGVKRALFTSTDKAVAPLNTYGCTKAVAERVIIQGNATYPGTVYACVRYGNVANSRGSVIEVFRSILEREGPEAVLPITDIRMTRFWITLPEAVEHIMTSLELMKGGEIFIPRMPSYHILDLMSACGGKKYKEVGLRPGEKLHEAIHTIHEDVWGLKYKDKDILLVYPQVTMRRFERYGKLAPMEDYLSYDNVFLTEEELCARMTSLKLLSEK